MFLLDIALFILFSIVLVKSSTITVRAMLKIAHYLRLNEFIISFIIFGIASSLPETFISISSAFRKVSDIGVGTLIGSNIADLTIVLGIVALYARKIEIKTGIFKWDMFYLLLCGMPFLLMMDRNFSRIDGAILVIFFLLYFNFIVANKIKYKTKIKEHITKKELHKNIALFGVGVTMLIISSNMIVDYASKLALDIGVPYIIVGLFLIALGTTLPELTFSLRSVMEGHKELGIGDILGVVIIDATFILGLTAIINPIAQVSTILIFASLAMFLSSIIAILFLESDSQLDWKEGIALIILYVLILLFASNYRYLL